jgi:hypothetical protein
MERQGEGKSERERGRERMRGRGGGREGKTKHQNTASLLPPQFCPKHPQTFQLGFIQGMSAFAGEEVNRDAN